MTGWNDGMATDGLRRKVAERLRGLTDDGWGGDLNLGDVLDALGAAPATFGVMAMCGSALVTSRVASADVARLADLIDRPTCRAVEFERASWHDETGTHRIVEVRCSNCGAEPWADLESVMAYCPRCGAEVRA